MIPIVVFFIMEFTHKTAWCCYPTPHPLLIHSLLADNKIICLHSLFFWQRILFSFSVHGFFASSALAFVYLVDEKTDLCTHIFTKLTGLRLLFSYLISI